jgi:ATP-dependent Clp protease protease subunit
MCFRVEHEFKGIQNKPETIVMPQMLAGQWSKTNYWKPVVCELTDEVDATSAIQIAEKLREAEELGQSFVPFFVHSNGGEVYALMSIVESMRRCKIPIYTYVSGYAASCAACIFSCGTRRFMARHARLLIHDVSVDFSQESNMTSSNLKTEAKEMRNLNKIIFQIMSENTGHPLHYFTNLVKIKRNNDIYVDAALALEWKLATDIGYPVVKVTHETTMNLDFVPETPFVKPTTSQTSLPKNQIVEVDVDSEDDSDTDKGGQESSLNKNNDNDDGDDDVDGDENGDDDGDKATNNNNNKDNDNDEKKHTNNIASKNNNFTPEDTPKSTGDKIQVTKRKKRGIQKTSCDKTVVGDLTPLDKTVVNDLTPLDKSVVNDLAPFDDSLTVPKKKRRLRK